MSLEPVGDAEKDGTGALNLDFRLPEPHPVPDLLVVSDSGLLFQLLDNIKDHVVQVQEEPSGSAGAVRLSPRGRLESPEPKRHSVQFPPGCRPRVSLTRHTLETESHSTKGMKKQGTKC